MKTTFTIIALALLSITCKAANKQTDTTQVSIQIVSSHLIVNELEAYKIESTKNHNDTISYIVSRNGRKSRIVRHNSLTVLIEKSK